MEAADVHQLNPVPDCQFEPETNASKGTISVFKFSHTFTTV